jgi:hypothetical protein
MSNLHNWSLQQLADEYGERKAQIDFLEEALKPVKEELKLRMNGEPATGENWTVTKTESISKRLDTKALREALGDDIVSEYEKETPTVTLRVKPTVRARGWAEE